MEHIGIYGQKLYPGIITEIEINDGPTYDLDLSTLNAQIDINNSFCESEKGGYIGLNNFLNSKVEVKYHKSAIKYNALYVEYTTYFEKEDELRFSGIHVSDADEWWFEMGHIKFVITGPFLKWLYVNRNTLNFNEKSSHDQSHQSTGFIVPIGDLMMLSEKYDKHLNQMRINEVYRKSKNG